MHVFDYYYDYEDDKDRFFGFVMGVGELPVFCIENTKEIVDIIKTNEMVHIDDVEGLRDMLVQSNIIPKGSIIKNGGLLR